MKNIFKGIKFGRVVKNEENIDKKIHIVSDLTMSAFINKR